MRDVVKGLQLKTKNQQICKKDDFLVAEIDAKVGGFGIVPKEIAGAIVSSHYFLFDIDEFKLDREFLGFFLKTPEFQNQIVARGSTNYAAIRPQHVLEINIFLPNIEEQKRIVSILENISDGVEEAKALQEEQSRLLSKLRQAILQEAVQGKLVPQDPTDEPASELLKRIKTEKERLIRENNKIQKEKSLPPISDEEIPYELPEGWVWCRLGGIYYNLGQKKPEKRFTYIDVSAIDKEHGIISDNFEILEPENAPSRARKIVKKGTVIYSTVRPYLLNIAIVDGDFNPMPIVSTAFAVMYPFEVVLNKYLFYYLRSKPFVEFVESKMVGMAYPAISDSQLNMGLFPLPPLNEQKRIVAKVDELMRLCDELEEQLRQSKEESERLMQAVLREAFEGKYSEEPDQEVSAA